MGTTKKTAVRSGRAARAACPALGADEVSFEDLIPKALLFYNIVEPLRPPEVSAGGIIMAQQTRETEELNQQVGVLRHRGTLSYQTQTPGLDYSKEVNQPQVGDFVFYSKNTGIQLSFVRDKLKPKEDPTNRIDLVLLSDTDILCVFTKAQADRLVGWAQ